MHGFNRSREQADLPVGNGEEVSEWETADLSLQVSRQQQGEEDQHGASEPESYTVIRT